MLLNVSSFLIDAVNRWVCHVANSPTCYIKKKNYTEQKNRLLTFHNYGYKVKVTTKIATSASHTLQPFKYVPRQFILDMQIFVTAYIHSLVNKLQRIYCNLIWQYYNLYLSLDQRFNAKIIKYFYSSMV
jgi:hypothetical protein